MTNIHAAAMWALLLACAGPARGAPSIPTWGTDVAPIVFEHCIECHQPDGPAPFSLLTYPQAAKRAKLIRRLTKAKIMPPWLPSDQSGPFVGQRGLSESQIATIAEWQEAGAPEGDALPIGPRRPPAEVHWPLGPPDLIVRMRMPFQIPSGPGDIYRAFPIRVPAAAIPAEVQKYARIPDTDLLGVSAVDVHPGNARVLHHAHLWADTTGQAGRLEQSPGAGYEAFGDPGFPAAVYLGGVVPGTSARRLPAGIAEGLPLDSDLVLQIHYSPTGKLETDQTEVGLYFTREPVKRTVEWLRMGTFNLEIPAGEKSHVITDELIVPADCFALSISPHMHYLGRSVTVRATLPDGTVKDLLNIPRWDFRWQDRYAFEDPVPLPSGTKLESRWIYDNSPQNPHNPSSPPRQVHFGPNITDEMCEVHLFIVPWSIDDYPKFGEVMRQKQAQKIAELTPSQRRRYGFDKREN